MSRAQVCAIRYLKAIIRYFRVNERVFKTEILGF